MPARRSLPSRPTDCNETTILHEKARRIPAEGFDLLAGHEIIIPAPLTAFTMDELAELIPTADAVVAGGKLPGEVIRAGKKLRIIANYGAGYDGVDVAAAAACGVPVTNIPETVTHDTAEL